jgi:hypothetical protein
MPRFTLPLLLLLLAARAPAARAALPAGTVIELGGSHAPRPAPAAEIRRRPSEGEIRWMEVRDWLKRASDSGKHQ